MKQKNATFTKRKSLALVFAIALALTAAILLRGCANGEDLSSTEGRQSYLQSLGWEIDPESEDARTVQLPKELTGRLRDYNEVQLQQGFDLRGYLGEQCEQYSYRVTNYPDTDQTVLATLYVQNGVLVAGDIHSTALNGFLQPLKQQPPQST